MAGGPGHAEVVTVLGVGHVEECLLFGGLWGICSGFGRMNRRKAGWRVAGLVGRDQRLVGRDQRLAGRKQGLVGRRQGLVARDQGGSRRVAPGTEPSRSSITSRVANHKGG